MYGLCDDELQTQILRALQDKQVSDLTETAFIGQLKALALEKSNPRVYRSEFYKIVQHPDEPIKDFLGHLEEKAASCDFICKKCKKDITEQQIEDQYINGMADEKIQTDLFANDTELTTLKDIVKHA